MNAAMPRKTLFVEMADEERQGLAPTIVYATALEYINLKLCVKRENRGALRVRARSEETDEEERGAQGRNVDAFLCEPRIPNYGQRRNAIVGLVLSERIYALFIRMACSATIGDKRSSGKWCPSFGQMA